MNVNGQTYTWDDNGNLLNDGSSLYRYDQANRLISTTLGMTMMQYAYNGDGARLKQIVSFVRVYWISRTFRERLPRLMATPTPTVRTELD